MGRERFELSTTAVSRRYPNQLDHRPTSANITCGLLTFNKKLAKSLIKLKLLLVFFFCGLVAQSRKTRNMDSVVAS